MVNKQSGSEESSCSILEGNSGSSEGGVRWLEFETLGKEEGADIMDGSGGAGEYI